MMNDEERPEVRTPRRRPKRLPSFEADKTAELKRELTDDEIALIAGGLGGVNETHTSFTPT